MGKMENPGALGGAAGAKDETAKFHSLSCQLRAERATSLFLAIEDAHPDDAIQICSAFLEGQRTADPEMTDPFGTLARDANLWADVAPPHVVVAHVIAGLDRLAQLALGVGTVKRAIVALWNKLGPKDRQAFISQVDPNGMFRRKGH